MNDEAKRALRYLASQHYALQTLLIDRNEDGLERLLASISLRALDAIEALRPRGATVNGGPGKQSATRRKGDSRP